MDPGTAELICKAIITAAAAAGGCVVLTPAILTGLGFGAGAAGLGWFGTAFWSVFGAYWAEKLSEICKINVTFNADP